MSSLSYSSSFSWPSQLSEHTELEKKRTVHAKLGHFLTPPKPQFLLSCVLQMEVLLLSISIFGKCISMSPVSANQMRVCVASQARLTAQF